MINVRLVWYLESSSLITEAQSGFWKTRSTMDHLVQFETFVREGFLNREHVVFILFDLEKAYDTTWKFLTLGMRTFLVENQKPFQILVFVLRRHWKNWILILTSSQSLNFLKLLHGHIQLPWSTSLFHMPRRIKRILRGT